MGLRRQSGVKFFCKETEKGNQAAAGLNPVFLAID